MLLSNVPHNNRKLMALIMKVEERELLQVCCLHFILLFMGDKKLIGDIRDGQWLDAGTASARRGV